MGNANGSNTFKKLASLLTEHLKSSDALKRVLLIRPATELLIYGKGADLGHLCSVHRLHSANATSYRTPLVHFINIPIQTKSSLRAYHYEILLLWPLFKGHCPQGPSRARHTCALYHQSLSSSSAHLCSSLALQGKMILKTSLLLNAHLCFSKADSLAHLRSFEFFSTLVLFASTLWFSMARR